MLRKLRQTEDDAGMLIVRLALGIVMFPHGAQKLLGWFGGQGFAATMKGALGTIGLMLGAIFMVHLPNGFFMNWMGQQKGEGIEYHILVLGMALAILIKGSGSLSVDRAMSDKGGYYFSR